MKVALFHHQPVPPRDYGGTERVCAWLAQGLVEAGHEVTLLSPEANPEESYSVRWQKLSGAMDRRHWDPQKNSLEQLKRRIPDGVDVLHSMVPLPRDFEQRLGVPVLTTIHGNGKPGEIFSPGAVFVSQDHARRHGRDLYVWNGLDPDEFVLGRGARSGFAFLAKTSWGVKNLKGAARICARAGVALTVAGGRRPWRIRLEALFRSRWKWMGRVSGQRKARLLAEARALLFPVLWPEPFGLVVAEALFSGTPVLATPQGSLPELLGEPGGLTVGRLLEWGPSKESEQRWAELLCDVDSGKWSADPEACRDYALRHFHYLKMTESYVDLYRRLRTGQISAKLEG